LTPGLRGAKFSADVLDLADIEPYLTERGLLSARAVVDGGLRVADVSRLNRVFLVTAEGERCLVVKLADEPGSVGVAARRLCWSGCGRLARVMGSPASFRRSPTTKRSASSYSRQHRARAT
jgi:hypothetical protein